MRSIADHIYDISNNSIKAGANLIKLKIEFNEESAYYCRFITHLKFFAQRLVEYKKTKQARRCFFESNT